MDYAARLPASSRLEHGARPPHVDSLHRGRVGPRVAVDRGEVEDRVAARDGATDRVCVEDVPGDHFDYLGERCLLRRSTERAVERDHVDAGVEQRSDRMPADEAVCAGDEGSHR